MQQIISPQLVAKPISYLFYSTVSITFFENKYHIHQRPFLWNFTIVDGLLTKSGTKNGDDSSDKLLRQHVGMLSEWTLVNVVLIFKKGDKHSAIK
jgi:hypothetical protein